MLSRQSSKLQRQTSTSSKSGRARSRRTHSESAITMISRSSSVNINDSAADTSISANRASTLRVGKRWQAKLSMALENAVSRVKSNSQAEAQPPMSSAGLQTAGAWWTWLTLPGPQQGISDSQTHDTKREALLPPVESLSNNSGSPTSDDVGQISLTDSKGIDNTGRRASPISEDLDQVVVSPDGVLWIPAPNVVSATALSVNSSTSSLPSRITSASNPSRTTLATTPGKAPTLVCSPNSLLQTPMSLPEEEVVVAGEVIHLETTSGVGLGLSVGPVSEWTDDEDEEIPVPPVSSPTMPRAGYSGSSPSASYQRSSGQSSRTRRRHGSRSDSLFWSITHNRWRGDGTLRHEMLFRWFEDRCSSIDAVLLEAEITEFDWDRGREDEEEFEDDDIQATARQHWVTDCS